MKKYNHAMDLGFEVLSDSSDSPTNEEIIQGLEKRLLYLKENKSEVSEACDIFDTHENKK